MSDADRLIQLAVAAGLGYLDLESKQSGAVPSGAAILADVLAETGLTEAYEGNRLAIRPRINLLHSVRLEGRSWLRREAERLLWALDQEANRKALGRRVEGLVYDFFGRAKRYLRELFTAGALAAGGPDPITLAEQEGLERNHQVQVALLDDFRDEVFAEDAPLDRRFIARAESYGSSVWSAVQDAIRSAHLARGKFHFERREHYGSDTPCDVCQQQQDEGWQPIGTLRSVGDSPCRSSCHCGFIYREHMNGPDYLAGRGPFDRGAFGVT